MVIQWKATSSARKTYQYSLMCNLQFLLCRFMAIASNFVLNGLQRSDEFDIHPWLET